MRPRRFVLSLTVPRTLAEDDEALQAFASMYWREMLERADGVPAENSMVRAIVSPQPERDLVHVTVIGYALPRIEVDVGIDVSAYVTSLDDLINGLVGREMTVRVPIIPEVEGSMSGSLFPVGGRHGIQSDDDIPTITDYQREAWRRMTTTPQDDVGQDAMRWTYEEGKKAL